MSATAPAAPRSATWREKEVLDLLSFWGEDKIQEALRSSHRNLDNFEKISKMMSSRGHRRTALECRNKTKSMRLEYKRVMAHNSTSGNGPITCPFFRELDSILRGDASVKPKRIARSISFAQGPPQISAPREVMEGSEELFSHDMQTIDAAPLWCSSPNPMAAPQNSSSSTDASEEDLDRTIDGLADKENDTTGANAMEDDDSDSDLPLGHRSRYNTADGADNRCLAEVSPGTRLFQLRNRRRRNAALYGVADDMMRRSREEHNVQVSQWRTDREMLCSWKADENKIQREFLDHTKMESEKFAEAWKQNISVMSDAVNTLKSLGQMLAQQRQIIPPTHDYGQTALPASQATPKKAAARRSCVGKARERLTL
ncbi:uncharacterized protein LOC129336117 [Eublepharis macularius]|uniref:Uncharacterized protein LOC129336117 n=2 Tax=Eublepharis macularius TaxID=481883 RepID=A0AA97L808_EUBMA|nr:uncharacterized protein LOC129336117 [Eublepharis macularius]